MSKPYDGAKKYTRGLAFVAAMPRFAALGSRVVELRDKAAEDRSKKQAAARSKRKVRTRKKGRSRWTSNREYYLYELRNYVENMRLGFWRGFEKLREHHPLDDLLRGQFSPEDPEKYLPELIQAFQALPEELKKPAPAPEVADAQNYSAEHDDNELDRLMVPNGIVVDCGLSSGVTNNQRQLFDWLSTHEDETIGLVRRAVVDYYQTACEALASDMYVEVGEEPYLPEVARGDELDELIRIIRIALHPSRCEIWFEIEAAWLDEEHPSFDLRLRDYQTAEVP